MMMMPLVLLLLLLLGSSIVACTTPSFMDAKTMARTCSIDRRDEDDDLVDGGWT
jgi:hypothetical protein